jgi:hypothetical protein
MVVKHLHVEHPDRSRQQPSYTLENTTSFALS